MNMILIWYLISDFDNDEIDQPIYDLGNELKNSFSALGFSVKTPSNAAELRLILQSLPLQDTILHICAHGSELGFIAPFNQDDIDRIRETVAINVPDFIVTYDEIREDLARIRGNNNLFINMMAVCNSSIATLSADVSISFSGLNNDFYESFEIYPLSNQLDNKIDSLNEKRTQEGQQGRYIIQRDL